MEQLILVAVVVAISLLMSQSKNKQTPKGEGAAPHKASPNKPLATTSKKPQVRTNAGNVFKTLMDAQSLGGDNIWGTLAEILESEKQGANSNEKISNDSQTVVDSPLDGNYRSGEGESLEYDGHLGGSLLPDSDHGHFEGPVISSVMRAEQEAERLAAQKQITNNILRLPEKRDPVPRPSSRSAMGFTANQLKNAVIMSEVLDKPVALRRRR